MNQTTVSLLLRFSELLLIPETEVSHRRQFLFYYFSNHLRTLLCRKKNRSAVPKLIYQVYVIELSKKVFTENIKFRNANPQFNGVLECLYVGMTSKTPAERLRQHKTGYTNKKGYRASANIVQKYGIYLRPSLYSMHIPSGIHFLSWKPQFARWKYFSMAIKIVRFNIIVE